MSRARIIRFGLIGTGHIAARFMTGIAEVAQAKVAICYNRTASKGNEFAVKHGIPEVADQLDDLLAAEVDAVYIATPHPQHAQLSLAALAAGKAVLCEKPAATSVVDFDTVASFARSQGLLYMEAMKPPFYPLYRAVHARIAAGAIGEVRFVRAGFANPNVPAGHAVLDPAQAGGALFDIGIYPAFLAASWLGEAQNVQTAGHAGTTGVDAFAAVQATHEHGYSQLYCGIDGAGSGEALIGGSQGYVLLHDKWWNPERATIVYQDGRREDLQLPARGGGLNYETVHFCELLRAGATESPILPHALTRAALALVCQARADLLP